MDRDISRHIETSRISMHSHRAEVQEPPQLCPPLLSDQRCQLMIVNLIMFPWALGLQHQRSAKITKDHSNREKKQHQNGCSAFKRMTADCSSRWFWGFVRVARVSRWHWECSDHRSVTCLLTVPASLYEEFTHWCQTSQQNVGRAAILAPGNHWKTQWNIEGRPSHCGLFCCSSLQSCLAKPGKSWAKSSRSSRRSRSTRSVSVSASLGWPRPMAAMAMAQHTADLWAPLGSNGRCGNEDRGRHGLWICRRWSAWTEIICRWFNELNELFNQGLEAKSHGDANDATGQRFNKMKWTCVTCETYAKHMWNILKHFETCCSMMFNVFPDLMG